jgi:hypothetical protein
VESQTTFEIEKNIGNCGSHTFAPECRRDRRRECDGGISSLRTARRRRSLYCCFSGRLNATAVKNRLRFSSAPANSSRFSPEHRLWTYSFSLTSTTKCISRASAETEARCPFPAQLLGKIHSRHEGGAALLGSFAAMFAL